MESKILNLFMGSGAKRVSTPKHLSNKDFDKIGVEKVSRHRTSKHKTRSTSKSIRFSRLPASSAAEVPYTSLMNFKGVVVPMGHGKTTLAKEEGWIDVDALLQPRVLADLKEEFYDLISSGTSVEEASVVLAKEIAPGLKLLNPSETVILMSPTFELLDVLGVECVGAIVVKPEVVLQANSSRDPGERLLIEKNIEEVLSRDGQDCIDVFTSETLDDVRWYIYCLCNRLSLPMARPRDHDIDDVSLIHTTYGTSKVENIHDVVAAYDQGLVSRELVNYQVFANGLKSYRGFGFTWNDWARTMSYAAHTRGVSSFDDKDWVGWPVTLNKISEGIPLEEHEDIQLLVEAHKGEHERFVLALILHWKTLGLPSAIAKKIFPLYSIRRVHWGGVFDKIREGIISSNSFAGYQLTMDEREMILSMRLLAAGSIEQLRTIMGSQGGSYPRHIPDQRQEDQIIRSLGKVKYSISDLDRKEGLFSKLVLSTAVREIRSVNWDGTLLLREQLIKAIGMELLTRWEDEADVESRVGRLLRSIAVRWYKASVIRDEWSDLACRLLETDRLDMALAHAIGSMLTCDIETGTSGSDWSIRIFDALKSFMVCALVINNDAHIVMQQSTNGNRPCILGISEAEIWSRIAKRNVPRSSMGYFANGVGNVQRLMEIGVWANSKTVMLMEMINAKSWMPKASDRMLLSCVVRWGEHFTKAEEAYMFSKLANCYTERILGRSYKSVKDRLSSLSLIAASDGGLECTAAPVRGKLEVKDKLWTGHGSVVATDRTIKKRSTRSLDKMLSDYEEDDGKADKRISTYGIHRAGLTAVLLLQRENKSRINLHCDLIDRFAK